MSVRLSRWLVSILLRRIETGSLIVLEGDERRVYGSGPPAATVQIESPRAWPKLLRGSRGMAEAFAQRLWDSPDLVALIRLAARNAGGLDRVRSLNAPVRWPLQRARALLRRSTRRRRRRDIAAHYDLGNELFSRMLDPTMSYSSAIFEHEGMTLEQAQLAKLDRVCEQLDLGPEDRVLEIGTGWGAFAIYTAATRGCHVTTTTISREQHNYTVQQVARAGLADRVTVRREDYRDLRGRYDKLVTFVAHAFALAELGYDERFRRLWTLYLAYCEAGFAERRIRAVQLLLSKPRCRTTSRAYPERSGQNPLSELSLSA